MTDVIAEYAQLSLRAEQLQRTGQRVPPGLIHRIQTIEATARTRLTPQQLEAAMQHVEAAKMRILSEQASHQREQGERDMQAMVDKKSRELTEGWLGQRDGLTAEQFRAVRDGKPLHFPRARGSQREIDATFRASTGMTEDQYVKLFDQLVEGGEQAISAHARRTGTDVAALRSAVRRWSEGDAVAHGVMKRRSERVRPSEPVVADRDTRRRAHLVDAILSTSIDKNDPRIIPTDSIREDSLRDDSPRGHIARAMEAAERGVDVATVSEEVGYRSEA